MKRAMFGKSAIVVLLCVASAACSPPTAAPAEKASAPAAAEGWTRPPMIRSVQRIPGGLVFSGQAEPGARVVLRSDSGPAHAAAADDQGRFEIRMIAPVGDLLLRPETQVGQDAAATPERLLIVAGGRGPVAILRTGGATRRLDRAPVLGAVDSDGRMRLVSGRSQPAGPPIDLQAGGESGRVTPDASGRWSLVLTPSMGPDEIRVGGRAFLWPGEGAGVAEGGGTQVERAGAGWRVVWSGPAGGRQTTWLPDAE
ncbi:hypothetical protein [Brevundimonas sp.]|uniref:hypothetical protein n=1 Tax=Brevundimonas sp. TaxID=1871086 RepID=UPI0027309852|nr:hypothetical protein [Brevundimonas sp.]